MGAILSTSILCMGVILSDGINTSPGRDVIHPCYYHITTCVGPFLSDGSYLPQVGRHMGFGLLVISQVYIHLYIYIPPGTSPFSSAAGVYTKL